MAIYEVGMLALRGISTQIFDIFFLFTVITGYLVMIRFQQVNVYGRRFTKKPMASMVEFIVQGICIGILFSLIVSLLGFSIAYTEYLYFILPISYVLGYYHVRYTNIVFSALFLAVLSLLLNGQQIMTFTLPDVSFNMAGLVGIVGILLVIEGILIYMVRKNPMVPVYAKKNDDVILGFAVQKFWPIPVVLLVATQAISIADGEGIPMPDWWPMIGNGDLEQLGLILTMMPLLFIMSHGTISFTKEPEVHLGEQAMIQGVSGVILVGTSFFIDSFETIDFLGVIVLFAVAYGPLFLEKWLELRGDYLYPVTTHGVRVLHVARNGLAQKMGFRIGDLLEEINGASVSSVKEIQQLIREDVETLVMKVKKHTSEVATYEVESEKLKTGQMGIIFSPDKIERIYDYDEVKHMGMMHMLKINKLK